MFIKIMNRCTSLKFTRIAFILLLSFHFTSNAQFAESKRKKKEEKVTVPKETVTVKQAPKIDVRGIDTLLKPISVVTQMEHDLVSNLLNDLDQLDGSLDQKIKNLKGYVQDSIIYSEFYLNTIKAKNYIENETFENHPSANLQRKKFYLKTLADLQKQINKSIASSKSNDLSNYYQIMPTFIQLVYAIKEKNATSFIDTCNSKSLFYMTDLLRNDDSLQKKIIKRTCDMYPELIANNLETALEYDGYCNVVDFIAKNNANKILTYLTSTSAKGKKIADCNNPLINDLKEIGKSKNFLRTVAFLGPIHRKEVKLDEVDKLAGNDYSYYKELIKLYQSDESLSSNVIYRDLVDISKTYVEKINELHDADDATRFSCVKGFSANELYYLMVLSSDEIYTSSFLGIYKRFISSLGTMKVDEFLQQIKMKKFRTFLRMCANYNTMQDLFAHMNPKMKNAILSEFVKGLADNKKANLEGAVDVADSFGSIHDSTTLVFLVSELKDEYELNMKSNNRDGIVLYKILYHLALSKLNPKIPQPEGMPVIDKVLLTSLLKDSTGTISEHMYFYGDPDGIGCFNGFIAQFRNKEWKIEEKTYWVEIKSTISKIPFIIYANKPLKEPQDEMAQIRLLDYFAEKNIRPSIVVHRGHSYHLPTTLNAINEDVKITILGSCGGYHNLTSVIARSPETHLISSKQIGSGSVNGPLLRLFHSEIVKGNDIIWPSLWNKLEKQMTGENQKSLFDDYVPPFRNMGAIFLSTFQKMRN